MVSHAVSLTLGCLLVLAVLTAAALFSFRFDISVEASGHLEPEEVWRAYSPSGGVIRQVLVDAGDLVEKGQVLVKLDTFNLEGRLEQLRLEAKYKLYDGRTPRSELEMLEQQISRAEQELARKQILSPARGVVLTEELEKRLGSFAGEGELLVEVGSPQQWKAALSVSEADIHTIEPGDPVRTRVPAFASLHGWLDEGFAGQVEFVGSEPLENGPTPARGAYRVYASIDIDKVPEEEMGHFKRGMVVESQVITRSGRGIDLIIDYLKRSVAGP